MASFLPKFVRTVPSMRIGNVIRCSRSKSSKLLFGANVLYTTVDQVKDRRSYLNNFLNESTLSQFLSQYPDYINKEDLVRGARAANAIFFGSVGAMFGFGVGAFLFIQNIGATVVLCCGAGIWCGFMEVPDTVCREAIRLYGIPCDNFMTVNDIRRLRDLASGERQVLNGIVESAGDDPDGFEPIEIRQVDV